MAGEQSTTLGPRPVPSGLQKPLPRWLNMLGAGLFVGAPVGGILGFAMSVLGYAIGGVIAISGLAANVICPILGATAFVIGAASTPGKWWKRLLMGLVAGAMFAMPYGLLAAGAALPWVFCASAILGAVAACAWLIYCRIKAVQNPLTPMDYAYLDRIEKPANDAMEQAKSLLQAQLEHSKGDEALKDLKAQLATCEDNLLPGTYDAHKKRMKKAGKNQFVSVLSSEGRRNKQTGDPLPSERVLHERSRFALKNAFDNLEWFSAYDLQIAVEMRALLLRHERLYDAKDKWENRSPQHAETLYQELYDLGILNKESALRAYQGSITHDHGPRPWAKPVQDWMDLCEQLGIASAERGEDATQWSAFECGLKGRHHLLEKIRIANTKLEDLEPLYQIEGYTHKLGRLWTDELRARQERSPPVIHAYGEADDEEDDDDLLLPPSSGERSNARERVRARF